MDRDSEPKENLPGANPVPVYVLPYTGQEDEISLIDLWRVLAAHKMLILSSLLVAIILASVYVFLIEPSYRAEVNLLPPQRQAIQSLMLDYRSAGDLDIEQYTPDLVYRSFLKNLKSKGLRREYFDTYNLSAHYLKGNSDASTDRIFDKRFDENLRVQVDAQDASFVTVSFADQDAEIAALWLNQLIDFVNKRTINQLISDVNVVIHAEIKLIRYQMKSKLKLAEQRRKDRILHFREALRVAKTLGIESASNFPMRTEKRTAAIAVNTAQLPLYMRGVKALEAEIAVLESRKENGAFVAGLRDLQERQVFLEGISIDRDKIAAVTIDAAARTPYRMEKIRKKMIFVLATVLGLMVGLSLVFIVELRSKMREQME